MDREGRFFIKAQAEQSLDSDRIDQLEEQIKEIEGVKESPGMEIKSEGIGVPEALTIVEVSVVTIDVLLRILEMYRDEDIDFTIYDFENSNMVFKSEEKEAIEKHGGNIIGKVEGDIYLFEGHGKTITDIANEVRDDEKEHK